MTEHPGDALRSALALRREEPMGRGEWLLVLLLCGACLAFWLLHYHHFYVPNTDYWSFKGNAKRLLAFQRPYSYKRMPTFPVLMGVLAYHPWLIGGLDRLRPLDDPFLYAALSLNIAFSAGSVLLVFLICRRWIGWAAIVPALLTATNRILTQYTLQPIGDASLLFFVLLTIYLHQRGTLWQYAAAFGAAGTRLDVLPLLPVICLLNLVREWRPAGPGPAPEPKASAPRRRPPLRRWALHLALTALAAAPAGLWAVLLMNRPRGAPRPYEAWVRQGPLERMNLRYLGTALAEPFNLDSANKARVAAVGVLVLIGVWTSLGFRRPRWLRGPSFRLGSAALILFGGGYTITHVLFGVNRARYAIGTQWIVHLYAVAGFLAVCMSVAPAVARRWTPRTGHVAAAVLGLAGFWGLGYGLRKLIRVESVHPAAVYVAFGIAVVGILTAWFLRRVRGPAHVVLPVLAFCLMCDAGLVRNARGCAHGVVRSRDSKYEYVPGARWMIGHLGRDEKAVVLFSSLLWHYIEEQQVADMRRRMAKGEGPLPRPPVRREQIVDLKFLDATNRAELAAEMRRRGIRYLVMTPRESDHLYDNRKPPRGKGKYWKWNIYLLEPFKAGRRVPGFRKAYDIPLPRHSRSKRAFIYEVLPQGAARR